jgi:membrane associated rhomboid family serine protease
MSSENSRSPSDHTLWLLVALPVVVHLVTGAILWSNGDDPTSAWWWERSFRWRLMLGGQAEGPVAAGQWWRLVTSTQLHVSGWHVLFNVLGLAVVTRWMLRLAGARRLWLWFAVGSVMASVASQLMGVDQSDGASGGLLAVVGGSLGWGLRRWTTLDRETRRTVWIMGALLCVELCVPPLFSGRLDMVAHVAGAAMGLSLGYSIRGGSRPARALSWVAVALYVLALAGGFVAAWSWAT